MHGIKRSSKQREVICRCEDMQTLLLSQISQVITLRYVPAVCSYFTKRKMPLRTPQLHVLLPEGREETLAAKLGQTVQYTKAVLHDRFNVPIGKQVRRDLSLIHLL